MKYLKILTLIFVTVTFSQMGRAQTVSTLVASFPGNDGLSVGSGGFIYVNDRGSWTGATYNGTRVMRVDPTDGSYTVFASGLNSFPVGNVFDRKNNLFVTGANSGTISRITSAGEDSLIASGMAGAGGLEFDSDGNLYCSAFSGNWIAKISPEGVVSQFAASNLVNGPAGMAFDQGSNKLYSVNWYDGRISSYELNGQGSIFVTMPVSPIGPMIISRGYLYAMAPNANRVYRVNLGTKEISVFAGTGIAGDSDGALLQAQFRNPIGINATANGDTLYISDQGPWGQGRLRRIILGKVTSVKVRERATIENFHLAQNYPNPFNPTTTIGYTLNENTNVRLSIFDVKGEQIVTLVNANMPAGSYQLSWNGRNASGKQVATGNYFYRLEAGNFKKVKAMFLIK